MRSLFFGTVLLVVGLACIVAVVQGTSFHYKPDRPCFWAEWSQLFPLRVSVLLSFVAAELCLLLTLRMFCCMQLMEQLLQLRAVRQRLGQFGFAMVLREF